MTISTTVFLEKGEKVQIGRIYPQMNCLTLNIGDQLELSIHAVDAQNMLDLLKGNEVCDGFNILTNGPSQGTTSTKQDGIDYLEEMISDRDLLNRVRAEKDAEDVAEAV